MGIPWIWIGVGWTMPFFFKPFRIAADRRKKKKGTDLSWVAPTFWTSPHACEVQRRKSDVTWRKLHLSEAFDGERDYVSVHQDVKLLSDAIVPGSWHIQDVARGIPALRRIYEKCMSNNHKNKGGNKSEKQMKYLPCFYRIVIYDTFGHFFHRHQSWKQGQWRNTELLKCLEPFRWYTCSAAYLENTGYTPLRLSWCAW